MPESYTDHPMLTERFDRALMLASEHHRRQLRKGTPIPYAAHLLAASSLVLEMHGDEDEAIGALLHDVVEDGGGRAALAEIEERFGPAVARIVLDNSDSVPAEGEQKPRWYERKKAYIDAFPRKSPEALRVCLADKLHNARSILRDYRLIGDALWPRFTGGKDGTLWYYRALVGAFRTAGPSPLIDELVRTVGELSALAEEGA